MSLVINGFKVKDIPLKSKGISFDKEGKKEIYLDGNGNRATKVTIQKSEYKWVGDDGTEVEGKTYKSINGKPIQPFSRTTIIDNFEKISVTELPYFVNNELTYLLVGTDFKEHMKEVGTAYSFKFINRGFKIYRAVAYYDQALDRVFMRCFQGDIRKMDLLEHEELAEIESNEVEMLSLESLEV
jgi:hypothetical protein